MVEFLSPENRVLRDKLPRRIAVTHQERNRLIKLSQGLGSALEEIMTIVSTRTFARWIAAAKGTPEARSKKRRPPGRPRTAMDIRELVLRIARETGFGFGRILGELKKLGVRLSKSTLKNTLKEVGFDPGPRRGPGTWDDFLTRQAATLWAADFLSVRSWTLAGFVDLYLLVFIHIGSRRVIIAPPTAHPNGDWVTQQARNATMTMDDWGIPISHLIIDYDTKFTKSFSVVIEGEGANVIRAGPLAPNLNAYAERFVQTLRTECLDHFIVCGEKHLSHLVKEFITHYHEERPHQGRGNLTLAVADADDPPTVPIEGRVECRDRLGGLLRHYYRAAA